ncbi:Jag protein [Halolactibacillus alkaliphilus]|uniref:RNA-binding protein KhpB n=1 Tax=Halolactibacillus alkaliphilus TaxID=442899 RepID=A0A511X0G6_9BACI|nr:RNA-binding cell elongation regulator Jag/EloR [Halolactibacillus alkaliphilus]GEN56411.1 Jag protein [Halolactibacillus alkaliphilus]GGN64575.1 Jag protein [Halolactibacillus alkaliphilus]SFO60828.1 spoIIIJ-associated protein [Halolactibacillus alkaliphilus]
MKQVTASGQTVKDAVQSALVQLNTSEDQVDIEVIEEGKKGMLGLFGSKRAIVKVTVKENPIEQAALYLKEIAQAFSADVVVTTTLENQSVTFELSGEKIAMIIGKRGQTLNALQHIVQVMLNRQSAIRYRVVVDAEEYRSRRKATLEQLATRLADKAIKTKKSVTLEPMPSYERKVIHSALQQLPGVETFSDGQEPNRHVVIKPVKK